VGLKQKLWQDKNVLITGHTGFKGSWLTLMLSELGAKVVGLALPPTEPQSLYVDAKISSLLEREYIQDIRNLPEINKVFESERIDYVIHLAAQALVRNSVRDPLESITTNITGTANVVMAALNSKTVMGITVVTTDKVYKNLDWAWPYRESDTLGGNDSYSASKAASELIVNALATSNNPREIPVTTVRAGNVIGGGDWGEERLVPDLIRSIMSSSVLTIRNANATRPWQYVLDCLYGYLLVAQAHLEQQPHLPNAFNFGPKESLTVAELVRLFEESLNRQVPFEILESNIQEHGRLALDSHRAESLLGWKPSLTPRQSITQTADWYTKFLAGSDAQELMRDETKKHRGNAW
jgi:CDP-glucose 4,6-dehydratase